MPMKPPFDITRIPFNAEPYVAWFKERHPNAAIRSVKLSGNRLVIYGSERMDDGTVVEFEMMLGKLNSLPPSP